MRTDNRSSLFLLYYGTLAGLFFITLLVCEFIVMAIGPESPGALLGVSALQDVIVFLLSAVVAARIFRFPLGVAAAPGASMMLLTLAVVLFSIPWMAAVVEWNESWTLPEAMRQLYDLLRQLEDAAQAMADRMLSGTSVGDLLYALAVVGLLTGFCEEIFFRGAIQGPLVRMGCNGHIAVWCTAILFSLLHFQFFGFVPRVLIGAFLGYAYWWSGSLWVNAAGHALNNSVVVIVTWFVNRGALPEGFGDEFALPWVLASLAASAAVIAMMWLLRHRRASSTSEISGGSAPCA